MKPQSSCGQEHSVNWAWIDKIDAPYFLSHSNMNRTELIEAVANESKLSQADVRRALVALIATIQKTVKKGGQVQMVGFGTFKSVKRKARTGKNPRTGVAVKIAATTVPKFVAGAKFKAVVDPKAAQRKAAKASK